MELKGKNLAIAVLSGAVLVLFGILLGSWLEGSVGRKDGRPEARNERQATTTESGEERASSTAAASEAPQSCPDRERELAEDKGIDYAPGSLLVTFRPGVSFAEASAVLDARGLEPHNTADARGFEENRWLTVSVPKGGEFEWICRLRTVPEVKYAGLNPWYDLAQ